jgi:uncharacterized protein (DUF488 family)
MSLLPIYTIGYGSRTIEELVTLLLRYQIAYLVDVRSRPYSRYKPEFSKDALQRSLAQHNIRYLFMGDTLGGIPDVPSLYTDGKVDYELYRQYAPFQIGIQRLRTAWEKCFRVVLMCSEGKPQECHRSKLLGEALVCEGIDVQHIDEGGELRTQQQVLDRLNTQPTLFELSYTSKKRYRDPSTEDEDEPTT